MGGDNFAGIENKSRNRISRYFKNHPFYFKKTLIFVIFAIF